MTTVQALADVNRALRADTMIYQASRKRALAERHGLSPTAYDHMPYAEWATIRDDPEKLSPTP